MGRRSGPVRAGLGTGHAGGPGPAYSNLPFPGRIAGARGKGGCTSCDPGDLVETEPTGPPVALRGPHPGVAPQDDRKLWPRTFIREKALKLTLGPPTFPGCHKVGNPLRLGTVRRKTIKTGANFRSSECEGSETTLHAPRPCDYWSRDSGFTRWTWG